MSEPSLDDALRWVRSRQVGPDPTLGAELQAAGREDYDYRARAVFEAFRTPAGQVALETLLRLTLLRAPVDHRLASDGEYLRFAQLRQGQNQAAAALLKYFDHGQTLEADRRAPAAPTDELDPGDVLAGRRSYGLADAGEPSGDAGWLDWFSGGPGLAVTA